VLRKLPLFGLSLASSLKLIGAWKTFAPARRALLASAELFSSMPVSSMHSLTAPWSLPPSVVNCEQAGGGEVGGSVRPSLRWTGTHFVLVLNEDDCGLLGVHGGAALGLGGRECAISGHDCGRAASGHDRLLDDERGDGG